MTLLKIFLKHFQTIEHYETAGRGTIKKQITQSSYGSRHERKLKRFSNNFNRMFNFFLEVNRKKVITFCGSEVEIVFDINGDDGKTTFRKFDDGHFSKGQPIITKHPNIVKSVIIGKKGWGLWRKEWCQGIAQSLFLRTEILELFEEKNIIIPESLIKEFEDFLWEERMKIFKQQKAG